MNDNKIQELQERLDCRFNHFDSFEVSLCPMFGYAADIYRDGEFYGMVKLDHPKVFDTIVKIVTEEKLTAEELEVLVPNPKDVRTIAVVEHPITLSPGTPYEEEDTIYSLSIDGQEYDLNPFTEKTLYNFCKQFEFVQGELTSLHYAVKK